MFEEVEIEKLVHGGQGIGTLSDGQKLFAWNVLPGERVRARVIKKRRGIIEVIAEEILEPSPERIEPRDEAYLSTSPWQIMTFEAENKYKQEILEETFRREKVRVDSVPLHTAGGEFHYRNKMEYSFWADDDGLSLALFHRGSHGKQIVEGSSIALAAIDTTANHILDILNKNGIQGRQLKTIVVRCNQQGESVAALFVKDKHFPKLPALEHAAKGIEVCFSNPKSPASVITRKLYQFGDITLTDMILKTPITYDVHSFFQVNLGVFEQAAQRINDFADNRDPKIDLFSGVGTIGIPINATVLIESDPNNITMAKQNVGNRPIEVVQAKVESALERIPSHGVLIVDPPRAGLHAKVIEKILEVQPPSIIYLSCNPITQARDLALLQDTYELKSLEGYNFFPRTPHIESLAQLVIK